MNVLRFVIFPFAIPLSLLETFLASLIIIKMSIIMSNDNKTKRQMI
jgi:hypothetical protein